MAKKNSYLDRQRVAIDVHRTAEKETIIQFMTDMITITLNDPAAMGNDTFGEQRIRRFLAALAVHFADYHGSLCSSYEADYLQVKLDQRLSAIVKSGDFHSFGERYEWIEDLTK